MLLRAEKEVQKGLLLEFNTATFAGECRVMWSSPTEEGGSLFGIAFVSLGPRAEEELQRTLYKVQEA